MAYGAGAPHIGSALSVADILYTLYFKVANITPENIDSPNRDRVILSKGHASAALYATLYEKGILSKQQIDAYEKDGAEGALPGHIDMRSAKGLDASAGSLAHGLSIAAGFACADRLDGRSPMNYVICGDGEMNEGSNWEAIAYIGSKLLVNVALIVDFNGYQASAASSADIIDQSNLAERLNAFGLDAVDIDGHDPDALAAALRRHSDRPLAIVAHTKKGKGVSFLEDTYQSHYVKLDKAQYAQAMKELEG
jgi:transketolase